MKLHLALCLTVALGVTAVPPGSVGADRPGESSPRLALSAAPVCEDVAVLTVDGGGQGWDDGANAEPATRVVARRLVTAIGEQGSTVEVRHYGRSFADASALVAGDATQPAEDAVTRRSTRAWRAGIRDSRIAVSEELETKAAACPEQVYVLAGEAQGASVVHRVLIQQQANPALAGRLVGAALVSDPDRVAGTRATLVGDPVASPGGAGVVTRELGAVADVPADPQALLVLSACVQGDLVCDLRRWSAQRSLEARAAYSTPEGRTVLRGMADALSGRASAWPRLVPDQVVTARPGARFSEQLQIRVGTAYADGVVHEAVDGLPSGVTLSRGGVLSGSVRSAGSWDVTVRVRGTAPATSASTGVVTVRVVDPATVTPPRAGGQTTCRVSQGTATCVGNNSYGQLGDGTLVGRTSPVQVGAAGEWAGIDTSGATTCGIKTAGTLFCWGMNNRGQLGVGEGARRLSPAQVGSAASWAQVSTSWLHTCAVRTTGTLWCWGENSDGQLGMGDRANRGVPTRVGTGTDWASVTTGGWSTCAVRTDGTAWCWGRNALGQLGTGDTNPRLAPAAVDSNRTWTSLDASWSSVCGLTQSGRALCWGLNDQGQLGDGTRTDRTSPTLVAGDPDWSALTVGDAFACGLDGRGLAWCWGDNTYGQLGTGSTQDTRQPVAVAGDRSWLAIDSGWLHTCATTVRGTMECWGNNERGQLARGDRTDRLTPPGVTVSAPRTSPRESAKRNVVVTSFNVLGSQHTEPGGGAKNYAPGRIRSEWTANQLDTLGSGIVAFQELQVDQYDQLRRSVGDTYAFYPANTRRRKVVWQSVMWEKSQWSFVEAIDIDVPVLGTTRPNPMVRLHNRWTGRDVWVLNVHNSSKRTPERQRERNRAVRIEIAHILEQRQRNFPVIFLGDMNERRTVFCKVTGRTDLEAVTGGSNVGGTCRPPRVMHLDWIFASPEFPVRSARFVRDAQVSRITDHSLLTSTLGVP